MERLFGCQISKSILKTLVEDKFFNDEISKNFNRTQRIKILTDLITWGDATLSVIHPYSFIGSTEGATTIITVYRLGVQLTSFILTSDSISESELDAEFENLLKLGF